jgi:hypothetical protein
LPTLTRLKKTWGNALKRKKRERQVPSSYICVPDSTTQKHTHTHHTHTHKSTDRSDHTHRARTTAHTAAESAES